MREYGFKEIYDYITEGGTVRDKRRVKKNAERLRDQVHYELQRELRERKKLDHANQRHEQAIYAEEERFFQLVNQVIGKIAEDSYTPKISDRALDAATAAGITRAHMRPFRWALDLLKGLIIAFYFGPIITHFFVDFALPVGRGEVHYLVAIPKFLKWFVWPVVPSLRAEVTWLSVLGPYAIFYGTFLVDLWRDASRGYKETSKKY